jgi:pimeloyl-ACP methyl ester carboxylesterase
MPSLPPSSLSLGRQRNWQWRGWRVRYTYQRRSHAGTPGTDPLPIVLIHGFGSALTQWHCNLDALSQQHPVYALDLIGFGGSEKAPAPYQVSFWVEQVHDFCQTFIGRPVLLVGHSLGAIVALATGVAHPGWVAGLVLMTLPASRQELLPRWAAILSGTVERLFANPLVVRPLFALMHRPAVLRWALKLAYADAAFVTDDLVEQYRLPLGDRGAAQTLLRLSKAATHPNYAPNTIQLLEQLLLPTLVLWGERDRIVRLAQRQAIFAGHSMVQLRILPRAGHCIYEECADQVNQAIQQWVEDLQLS